MPGTVPANTWYVAMLPALVKSANGADITSLDLLTDALARPLPDRGKVTALAESSSRQLPALRPTLSQDLVLATLDRVLAPRERTQTWDEVSQECLALAAWRRSVAVGKQPGEITPEDAAMVDDVLRQFRAAFPRGFDTPRASPVELERRLREVVQRLRKK